MSPGPRRRRGHSLIEIVIALALLALVLSAVVGTTVRTWRSHLRFGLRADARAQLQAATHAIAHDLRGLSGAAGDITSAAARDSAIELRTIVGQGAVCDTTRGLAIRLAIAPDSPAAPAPLTVSAGDTMWIFVESDTTAEWHGVHVTSARRDGSLCARDGSTLVLSTGAPPARMQLGAPVRLTRRVRWSLYRNANGWFLGRREWNVSLGRFDVVQPVAGPLAPYGAASGLELRYFDAQNAEVPSGSLDTRRITRVDVTLHARAPQGRAVADSERISIAVGRTEAAP
jgi:prepilin-type N-terminal cleavage/methylation domain-containing protein